VRVKKITGLVIIRTRLSSGRRQQATVRYLSRRFGCPETALQHLHARAAGWSPVWLLLLPRLTDAMPVLVILVKQY
jgi:hypothetical protein